MVNRKLVNLVIARYPLAIEGIHGISHWLRVRENGLALARQTGANRTVVELFALFHDSQRYSEGNDPKHGRRGATLAVSIRDDLLKVMQSKHFELLFAACSRHTIDETHENITVQTCFDADRLDLGRVGFMPNPNRLCTEEARREEVIRLAYERSIADPRNWDDGLEPWFSMP